MAQRVTTLYYSSTKLTNLWLIVNTKVNLVDKLLMTLMKTVVDHSGYCRCFISTCSDICCH